MNGMNAGRGPAAREHDDEHYVPFPPHREIGRRSRNIFILGLMLAVAFVAPVMTMVPVSSNVPMRSYGRTGCGMTPIEMKSEFSFFHIETLFGGGSNWFERVMAGSPLIAGAGAILLALLVTTRIRGWALMGLWAIPIVATLIFVFTVMMSNPVLGRMAQLLAASALQSSVGYVMLALSAGLMGIFVGSRVRWYRPQSKAAFWIGRIGGVLFVAGVLAPVLGRANGYVLLLVPFTMMSAGGMLAWLGFWLLVSMGLMIAAAVVCFGNGLDIKLRNVHHLSGRGFAFWRASLLLIGSAFAVAMLWTIKSSFGMLPMLFFAGIQIVCWGVAWWLLLPVGLTDLLLGEPMLVMADVGASADTSENAQVPEGPVSDVPPVDPFARPNFQSVSVPDVDPFYKPQPGEEEEQLEPAQEDLQPAQEDLQLEPVAVPAPTKLSAEGEAKLAKLIEFRDAELLTDEEFEKRKDVLV